MVVYNPATPEDIERIEAELQAQSTAVTTDVSCSRRSDTPRSLVTTKLFRRTPPVPRTCHSGTCAHARNARQAATDGITLKATLEADETYEKAAGSWKLFSGAYWQTNEK